VYGKLFASIYDGSMHGHWEALVTFQQMICLANRDGVIDMTPSALASRTSIPIEIIHAGIAHLLLPDPESRSPECDGRRIETIDVKRSWGWRIVNYDYYRKLASMEDKLLADRERIARKREDEKATSDAGVAACRNPSKSVAEVAHAEVEVEVEVEEEAKKVLVSSKPKSLKKEHPLPEGFAVSPEVAVWAEKEGFTCLPKHLDWFVDWAISKGKVYVDWNRAFKNAIRGNWAKVTTTPDPQALSPDDEMMYRFVEGGGVERLTVGQHNAEMKAKQEKAGGRQ